MRNKKLWVFIGIVILILILNHIFGWSTWLGDTDHLKFLEELVQENFVLAIGIYMAVTIVGSVALALPGITFAILAGLLFGPVLGTVCCWRGGYGRSSSGVCGGKVFLKRQY